MPYRKPCGSILEAIGNTPLVRLRRVVSDLPVEVFAKLEFLNPMGSSKDRISKFMIEAAERDGRLKPGDTIIENSSGNTAMGLALMAIQKGYRIKVVVRDTISQEKLNQLLALGAQVHKVDTSLPPEHPDSYNNITPRLARETPNCFFPDQHGNKENNAAHYAGTGPEIWEQMEGRIDAFVAGAGTGGTVGGVGRYLKEKDPNIRVIAVDPVGSVFSPHFRGEKELKAGPYKIEGLGDEFLIPTMEFDILDDMLQVTDAQAFHHARRLVREEGVLGGGSSGAALWAVREVARRMAPMDRPSRIVTVFPDGAGRYLSTIFNDQWLAERGLLEGSVSAFSGTYVEAVRQALHDAMEADPRVCCLGEDIGAYGGAFRATEGLLARFGPDRVIDTPIAEQAIAGSAIGLALMGQRPVAEFQFMDFALLASDLMVNFAAKAHWRWGAPVPAVFRGPSGGGNGGGPFHSQNPEGHFLGSPGLKVVAPGTVRDAYALLRAAIEDPDPVMVFEHKHLYRRLRDQWDEPPTARLGEAALRKDGGAACIITYGAAQHVALTAVADLDVAVLDLRTLWPLDDEAIAALAKRTHRVLVLTEASRTYGPGAELAARIGETCFPWLDAPVLRVGATDTPTPASPPLEAAALPSAERVRAELDRLQAW